MLPENGKPRELLWYHQIQQETRHLLQRINSQQSEIETLSGKLNCATHDKAESDREITRLKEKQDDFLDSRRQDFDREKELLKRVGSVEASVNSLGQQMAEYPAEVVDVTASEECHALEQRIVQLERRPTGANENVEGLKRQMTVLEAMLKSVEARVQEQERSAKSVPPTSAPSVLSQTINGNESVGAIPKEGDAGQGQVDKEKGKEKEKAVRSNPLTIPTPGLATTDFTAAVIEATASGQVEGVSKPADKQGTHKRGTRKVTDERAQEVAKRKEMDRNKRPTASTTLASSGSASATASAIDSTAATRASTPTSRGQVDDGNESPEKGGREGVRSTKRPAPVGDITRRFGKWKPRKLC